MPEVLPLSTTSEPITGWVMSDFPSTLAQAQLFVEKVSGYHESRPPEWRGDRSSLVYPAEPTNQPPPHRCADPGVDAFIKIAEADEALFKHVVSSRVSSRHDCDS